MHDIPPLVPFSGKLEGRVEPVYDLMRRRRKPLSLPPAITQFFNAINFIFLVRLGSWPMLSPAPPIILLGPNSQMFIGPLGVGKTHTHAANVALVALEKPFLLRMGPDQEWKAHESTLISAGTPHELDPQKGWCAVIYSDIYAPRWQAMQPAPRQPPPEFLQASHELKTSLSRLVQAETLNTDLITELGNALENSLGTAPQQFNRMQLALRDQIREHDDLDLNDLASAMHLSPSRVQHLFLNDLGVSYKRLQHWVRFRGATRRLEEMSTLTEAALEYGFSDSSHFSNAFKAMFGVSAREAGIAHGAPRFWQTPW